MKQLSLKQLQRLVDADTATVREMLGLNTSIALSKKPTHGEVKVLFHDTRENLEPWIEPATEVRGPARNQREALRRSHKYLGLLSCPNCATRFTNNGCPIDGKGRVFEEYKTGKRWCYVCGLTS